MRTLHTKLLYWAISSFAKNIELSHITVKEGNGNQVFSFVISPPLELKYRRKIKNHFGEHFSVTRTRVNGQDDYDFTPLSNQSINFSLVQTIVDISLPDELAHMLHLCTADEANVFKEFITTHFTHKKAPDFENICAGLYFYQLKNNKARFPDSFDAKEIEREARSSMIRNCDFALEVAKICAANQLPIPKEAINHMVTSHQYFGQNKNEIDDIYLDKALALEIESGKASQENEALIRLHQLYLSTQANQHKNIKRFAIALSDAVHDPQLNLPKYSLSKYVHYIMLILKDEKKISQSEKIDCLIVLHQFWNICNYTPNYRSWLLDYSVNHFSALITKYPDNNVFISSVLNNILSQEFMAYQAEKILNINNAIVNKILINYIENNIYKNKSFNAKILLKVFLCNNDSLDNYPQMVKLFSELAHFAKANVVVNLRKLKYKSAAVFQLLIKYYDNTGPYADLMSVCMEAIAHRVYVTITSACFNNLLNTVNANKVDIVCFYKRLTNTDKVSYLGKTFTKLALQEKSTVASHEQKEFVAYIHNQDMLAALIQNIEQMNNPFFAQQIIDASPQQYAIHTTQLSEIAHEISAPYNSSNICRAIATALEDFCKEDRYLSMEDKIKIYWILESNQNVAPQLFSQVKHDTAHTLSLYTRHFQNDIRAMKKNMVELTSKNSRFPAAGSQHPAAGNTSVVNSVVAHKK